jgi:hypothetical protein
MLTVGNHNGKVIISDDDGSACELTRAQAEKLGRQIAGEVRSLRQVFQRRRRAQRVRVKQRRLIWQR